MKNLIIVFVLFVSTSSGACFLNSSDGFLTPNNLSIPVDSNLQNGLNKEQYNAVIDKVESIYIPIISNLGGKLKVLRLWEDDSVGAWASRSGSTFSVEMYGGLARHKKMTEDGLALVLCHEIGHHLGGAPNSRRSDSSLSSIEGQADYFAVLKCLRKTFLNDNNQSIIANMNVPSIVSTECNKNFKNKEESALCIRTSMAGFSIMNVLANNSGYPSPKFETPFTTSVTETVIWHPGYQCRLDTYFQGSLCEVSMNEDVSHEDEVKGTCHGSLGHKIGLRPTCWFKPSIY